VSDSFGGRIMGSLNLVKAGAADSTLTLRGANAVAGAVFVRGGTLAVDETGTLGAPVGGVTVESGTLLLQNSAALADSTTVRLPETGDGGAKIQLAAGVEERVGWLFYGETMRRAGTYGSTASPAQVKDDARFAGTGVLRVLHDNAGTVITLK
jgi:autotransporter-associated beta strand protein